MQLKKGVSVGGIFPEVLLALYIADQVYRDLFKANLVVTSLRDGKHKAGSKHFSGQAADLRIWGLEDKVGMVVAALSAALGKDYDVVAEVDHIHLEYDPHL